MNYKYKQVILILRYMIGRINIIGQIGDTINEDGSIKTKGVQLQDVVIQVNNNKLAQELHVYINSGGGEVSVGQAIARYLSKLPNVTTIANELCGSIATEIHLAVPIEKRKIVAGTEYFIHNPLLDNVRGNSDQLIQAANHIKPYETAMLNMYAKATGLDKASLQGLMSQETSLTDSQCKELGFVSEIIPKQNLRAVAFYNQENNNQNKEQMEIKEMFAEMMAVLKSKPNTPKAATAESDKGVIEWASDGAAPEVGEAITIDGNAVAEAMDLTLTDGTVIKVGADGLVTEVVAVEAAVEGAETIESLKAKIAELEASKVAEIASMKEQIETEVKAELETIKAAFTSSFVPKASTPTFNKGTKTLTIREQAESRKTEVYRKK